MRLWAIALALATLQPALAQSPSHPRLAITQAGVSQIRAQLGQAPLFDATLAAVRAQVDAEMAAGIDVPIPRDFSGGYTHERHKRNYRVMQQAGLLFQILEEEKYAALVRDLLLEYAAMYKTLPLHPEERSYARGRLFWQCLNDANWLLHASQAYDAVHGWLSAEARALLERDLFRPFADHLSIDNPQFFNRVHNHSTWGAAAVGMIGLVMGDEELVQRALYGIPDDGLALGEKDDDGGFIRAPGQAAGFFANLREPFSPDGYYTEGPYYQRYAMYPFLVFARSLSNARPDLRIFQREGAVLLKAVLALLQLADADGEFFPLNDAQKGMSWQSPELVTAVNLAYHLGGEDPQLLSIAEAQGQTLLDAAGLAVALALNDGKARPFRQRSVHFTDGADGAQGGLAVLRHLDSGLALVFKYTAQGLSHGHYDKLSISFYDQGDEVLQDYGMVRFVNIEAKGGGNYLPENAAWAKQTIAHNTLVQNGESHFQGDYALGSQRHSDLHFFHAVSQAMQAVSAIDTGAYPGTAMQRTLALVKDAHFEKPFLLDIFKASGGKGNQYDLPFHYLGQVMHANFEYRTPPSLAPLGQENGYQHLHLEAAGRPGAGQAQLTWLNGGRFYSLTSATGAGDDFLFARLGANDPEFNLRREPAFILRRKDAGDTVFATVIEAHGAYSPVSELAESASSSVKAVRLAHDDAEYTAVAIEGMDGRRRLFVLANRNPAADARHKVAIDGKLREWTGPCHYFPSA